MIIEFRASQPLHQFGSNGQLELGVLHPDIVRAAMKYIPGIANDDLVQLSYAESGHNFIVFPLAGGKCHVLYVFQ